MVIICFVMMSYELLLWWSRIGKNKAGGFSLFLFQLLLDEFCCTNMILFCFLNQNKDIHSFIYSKFGLNMNISPNLLISPFAFPNKQASPCALGDFALGSAHQIKPQIQIHVATNRIYRVEWFNPLPPQHLCPIKRGLPGGPRLGTPPKLLSFKEAGVVAGMLFIPIQGRIMVGHIATHDSGLFFFFFPLFPSWSYTPHVPWRDRTSSRWRAAGSSSVLPFVSIRVRPRPPSPRKHPALITASSLFRPSITSPPRPSLRFPGTWPTFRRAADGMLRGKHSRRKWGKRSWSALRPLTRLHEPIMARCR